MAWFPFGFDASWKTEVEAIHLINTYMHAHIIRKMWESLFWSMTLPVLKGHCLAGFCFPTCVHLAKIIGSLSGLCRTWKQGIEMICLVDAGAHMNPSGQWSSSNWLKLFLLKERCCCTFGNCPIHTLLYDAFKIS